MGKENGAKINSFSKGLIKSLDNLVVADGFWTHARNAINRTHQGDVSLVGNDPANLYSARTDYTIVGLIHKLNSEWIVFSTNNVIGEIGIYNEHLNIYTTLAKSKDFGFSTKRLISGVSKQNYDLSYSVYFQDGNQPDRFLNLSAIPYKTTGNNLSSDPNCYVPEYSAEVDCEKMLLQPVITLPSGALSKAQGSGQLLNGSYQAAFAYSINGIRVTGYYGLTNIQSLYNENHASGALVLNIESMDKDFEEFELVMITTVNMQTVVRKIGNYSTSQHKISIGYIDQAQLTIPISDIFVTYPSYKTSDGMFDIGGYLIRTGVRISPDFNYQPYANNIQVRWVAVEYPATYYRDGGNKTTFMRDEQYPFFLRWIYTTSYKSASYHIPGRKPTAKDLSFASGTEVLPGDEYYWRAYNTATRIPSVGTLEDGGRIVAKGDMGYWESSELYPDNQFNIWGENCGKPIRHHKFPDNSMIHIHDQGGNNICLLGVEFSGIQHPVDNNGVPISDIVGYEILVGSREGNKTILAKGMFNNMWEYDMINHSADMDFEDDDSGLATGEQPNIRGGSKDDEYGMNGEDVNNAILSIEKYYSTVKTGMKGLYQNFPYNDLRPNKFLRKTMAPGGDKKYQEDEAPTSYKKDYFSFHSPDTLFNKPYLTTGQVKLYTEEIGVVFGSFEYPHKHPLHKVVTNTSFALSIVVGIGVAVIAAMGKASITGGGTEGISLGIKVEAHQYNTRESGSATALFDNIAVGIGFANPKLTLTTIAGFVVASLGAVYYGALGINTTLETIYTFGPYRQYGLQYNSHGKYDFYSSVKPGNTRRNIKSGKYIGPHLQQFDVTHRINNLYRNEFVAMQLDSDVANPDVVDDSRVRVRDLGTHQYPTDNITKQKTSAYYGAIKIPFDNQYGQLESIVQIPTGSCVFYTEANISKRYSSGILFGGDVYINTYSEKNPYMFFNTWLMGESNGTEFNYKNYINGPFPRYWANFEKYDLGDMNIKLRLKRNGGMSMTLPSDYHSFDKGKNAGVLFVNHAYFYVSCNGVREFFVESEMNLAFRENGIEEYQKHYSDTYTDLSMMFRSDYLSKGNYCKYDNSLSVSKLFNNFISVGSLLSRDYNPSNPLTFADYFPNKAVYSLQQQKELKRDNWKVYLANNYYDFKDKVTSIKSMNESGALILFQNSEPVSFVGQDQLKTVGGTKITIGDGGLFSQPLSSVTNADNELEYGSCQSSRSAVNTPYGMFFISQTGGHVFEYLGQLAPISDNGMKHWFSEYLPSRLMKAFPNYLNNDNPVTGVGCQSLYDPLYAMLYFSKRDYKPFPGVGYDGENFFVMLEGRKYIVQLGDPVYFEDCSWTISYDPTEKMWLSFYDWIPQLGFSTHTHFITTKDNTFWRHNTRTDLYSNYYGKDYPWEVEFPIGSGIETTIMRNAEYILENYVYKNNGRDRLSVADHNFDKAIVWNTEQISGMLNLVLKSKVNPIQSMYARAAVNSTDAFFSKEENKYRFNQFSDITKNYGEFANNDHQMWITGENGYSKRINPQYVDFSKPVTQRKRFRHYNNVLWLGKTISNNVKMLLKIVISKQTPSAR